MSTKTRATRLGALALSLTAAHIAPLLAMDAQITLPKDLFGSITSKNFKDKRTELLAGVRAAVDGKLRKGFALDASTDGLAKLLDALGETAEGVDESVSEPQEKAMAAAAEGKSDLGIPKAVGEEFAKADDPAAGKTYDEGPLRDFLKQKGVGDADIEEAMKFLPKQGAAEDKDPDEGKKDEEKKDMVGKQAMDAAITTAVTAARKTERDIATAREFARPWVGDIPTSMAFDSADDVYKHALKMLDVGIGDDVKGSALKTILEMAPRPGAPTRKTPAIAMDAKSAGGIAEMFPGIERVGVA
jgi:hypothetical protein